MAARRIDGMSADEIARYIAEVSVVASDGYKQNHCERCQDGYTAASNTGFFILRGLGYQIDEIRQMFADVRAIDASGTPANADAQ